jgi:DNA invertase Pin-like site-specific DNA recombinase
MAVNKIFGYARISSDDQNEARQIEALTAAGVDERFIFVDKASGR